MNKILSLLMISASLLSIAAPAAQAEEAYMNTEFAATVGPCAVGAAGALGVAAYQTRRGHLNKGSDVVVATAMSCIGGTIVGGAVMGAMSDSPDETTLNQSSENAAQEE